MLDEKGQNLVEYALIAGFVGVAAVVFMPGITENELWIRVSCGILALILLALIYFQRRKNPP